FRVRSSSSWSCCHHSGKANYRRTIRTNPDRKAKGGLQADYRRTRPDRAGRKTERRTTRRTRPDRAGQKSERRTTGGQGRTKKRKAGRRGERRMKPQAG